MTVKYAPVAERIVDLVGGAENIESAYHCQTRLRFSLKDDSKAKADQIGELDGVAQALTSGGVFQVVIGTHVKDVFDEVDKTLRAAGVNPSASPEKLPQKRPNVFLRVVDFVSSTFTPIIPALAGAGMVSALLAVLVTFNLVSRESQSYAVINFIANSCFFFLPIFLAFSAAGKLGINRILAAVVASMLLHPTWAQMVTEGAPVTLFNLVPLTLATYSSTVIPVLIIVWVQSYVEKFLERVIPNAIKIVVVPMLVFFVMGILAFAILGPVGAVLGGYLADGFLWLGDNAPWAPPLIVGTLLPIMVMFGIHTAVGPIGLLQLGQFGYDAIFGPGALCSNIAMGTATAVVALRTKEAKFRQIATAGAITGFMGITEPALYGVALPKRYPLIAAMIGGGSGGLFAGLTATRRFAVGSSGLPAVPMYIGGDTLVYFFNILIALAIAIAVTTVLTVLLALRFERSRVVPSDESMGAELKLEPEQTHSSASSRAAVATAVRTTELTAPCRGTITALSDVQDAAFASGALGPGVGIEPLDGAIVAPCSGTIVAAMESGHAYGIRTDDGIEVLVHVGIDTVQLKGQGFAPAVTQGERVTAGQLLVTTDLPRVRQAGHAATVVLVVTALADSQGATPIADGKVVAGEPILRIDR